MNETLIQINDSLVIIKVGMYMLVFLNGFFVFMLYFLTLLSRNKNEL